MPKHPQTLYLGKRLAADFLACRLRYEWDPSTAITHIWAASLREGVPAIAPVVEEPGSYASQTVRIERALIERVQQLAAERRCSIAQAGRILIRLFLLREGALCGQ